MADIEETFLQSTLGAENDDNIELPPVILEIESRQNIALLLNNMIQSENGGDLDLEDLARYLKFTSKVEWNKIPGCHFSPNLKLETFNAANEKLHELEGPYQPNYLCFCACTTGSTIPIKFQGSTVVSFTYDSVVCTPCSAKPASSDVYIPACAEPIGRIEYTTPRLLQHEATITDHVTGNVFRAHPTSNGGLPGMEIRDVGGNLVAAGGVTFAHIRRGVATFRGIKLYFPSVQMPVTTKAILMIFGTLWQMDHQQHNCRGRLHGLWIAIVLLCLVVGVAVFFATRHNS